MPNNYKQYFFGSKCRSFQVIRIYCFLKTKNFFNASHSASSVKIFLNIAVNKDLCLKTLNINAMLLFNK